MIYVEQINDPVRVLALWSVFETGLREIARLTGESVTTEEYCRMLVNLSTRPNDAWIGVSLTEDETPLSYGVAVDSTPPHAARRTFTVNSFYAMPGRPDATEALMREFESWAARHEVASYIVTTRRDSGAAVKCFRSSRYGFRKSFTAFEKHIHNGL